MLIALALLTAALTAQQPRSSRTLLTPHYTVKLDDLCDEYDVGCEKVRYTATSKDGKSITLMGKQIMAKCADGTTPCHSLGYRFLNHGVEYLVSEDGELTVRRGGKTLLDEQGKWQGE